MNNYLSLQHLRKAVESLLIKINEKFNFVNDKVDTLDEGFESLTDVAFSGDYNDLNNKPSIPTVPTNISAFNNDAGYIVYDEENYTEKNFPIVVLFCDRGVSSFYVQKVDTSNYKALIFVSRPHNPEIGSPKYFNLGSLTRLKYSDNLSSSYFSIQSCAVYDKNNTVQENNYLYENKWYYLKATKNNNNNLDVIFYELPFLTNGDIDLTNYALKTDIPENELFIATYGTTTYAEILAAYNANKIIVCKYTLNTGDLIVPFNYYVKPSAYVTAAFHFATVENSNSTRYLLSVNSSNNWNARNNIINALSSANTTIEEGDRIVFTNTNGAYRLASNSSLAFGTATNQYLANNGTWQNIPTSISELTNDSGYITSSDIYNSDWNANENENGYILNRPFYTENVNLNGEYTCTGNGTPSAIIDFDGSDTTLNTLVDSAPGTISITFDNTNYTLELVSSSLSYVEYQDPNSGVDLWLNKNNGYITDFGYISSNNISNGSEYILTISATDVEVIHKLDPKYYDVNIDLSPYMQKGQDYVTAGKKTGTSLGINATAEGMGTTATGQYAHAEGNGTVSSARSAHAEGTQTSASGLAAHAEGMQTTASGDYSHAEGAYTAARYRSQHVFGEYNILEVANTLSSNRGTYVEIVGNGTSSTRSNARTLDWFGNEVLAGKLTVGTGPTNNMDVATKQYVDTAIGNINGFEVAVVNSLPTENIDTHTFYFMSNSGSGNNIYDEYLYINNAWEKIGTTEIDLSGYVVGPNSSTNNHVATFNGTDGRTIQDSGYTIGKSVPSNAIFTDQLVRSVATTSTTTKNYPILLHSNISSTETAAATKSSVFYFHIDSNSDYYLKVQNATLKSSSLTLGKNYNSALYSTVIQVNQTPTNSLVTLTLPSTNGILALTSDIPSVPSWALQSTKPSYTASEVGALSDSSPAAAITSTDITNWNAKADINDIPTSLSDLTNDPGYITSYTETDPIFSASAAASITNADITNWNAKSDTDEKVKTTLTSSTNANHYFTFSSSANTETNTLSKFSAATLYEASINNMVKLILGTRDINGMIRLYHKASSEAYTDLASYATTTRMVYFPDKAGTIALTSDIPTIPTNVSAFTNDAGYLTSAPVTSVNGQTGDITIADSDEKVKSSILNKTNGFYPLLFAKSNSNSDTTDSVYRSGNILYNDYQQELHINEADGNRYLNLTYNSITFYASVSLGGYLRSTTLTQSRNWYLPNASGTIALTSDIPTSVSELTNDAGYLTSYTETDPTVPEWAKAASKPTYTASEVGALPDNTDVTKWNGVSLAKQQATYSGDTTYVPATNSLSPNNMSFTKYTYTPTANAIAKYDANSYLHSTTPSASDNSNKVATTAYVDSAIGAITYPVTSVNSKTGAVVLTAADVGAVPSEVETGGGSQYGQIINSAASGVSLVHDNASGSSKIQLIGRELTLSSTKSQSNSSIVLKTNNTNVITLSEGQATIIGVVTPTTNDMAANKGYVDSAISALTIPTRYNSSTNTTGYLTMADLPIYDGTVI